ncbi:MAG: hypothetical protein KAR24_02900 [Candidatus Pacebacteria bacterium]|nr:hypothetical protein [Candidatus Paceibacterota bacterium]
MKFLVKLKNAIGNIFCDRLTKESGLNYKDHGLSVTIIAWLVVLLIFTVVLAFFIGVGKVVSDRVVGWGNTASVEDAFSKEKNNTDSSIEIKECEYQQQEKWHLWDGQLVITPTGFILPENVARGLYSYSIPLQKEDKYTLKFSPQGDVINYVVLIPNLFELVVGDNDYKTIYLKISNVLEEAPVYAVEEEVQKTTRPSLRYAIKKGTTVGVKINQSMEGGALVLHVEIVYVPDVEINSEPLIDDFTYKFIPSPIFDIGDLALTVGFFRGEGNQDSEIRGRFICPLLQ